MKHIFKKYGWFGGAAVAAVIAVAGIGYFRLASPHTAKAQGSAPASTVVFGLNVYGYSVTTTATVSQSFTSQAILDASGYLINPSDYQSGVPHKIYLNASSFSVDFRVGVQICQDDGTNCHVAWTPWAYDVATGKTTNPYSAIAGAGPNDGGTSSCGVPTATLHNRLGDIVIGAQTRPLPSGTVLTNVTLSLFPLEWDFNVPVDNVSSPSCWNPSDTQVTPGITPYGGGWSSGAFDKWSNASTDGFVVGVQAGSVTYNAQPVSSNIPTSTNPGATSTTGTDGQPLQITMKNTGTVSWPSQKGAAVGAGTGTCQVDTNGDGIADAPIATSTNYGKSCTVNYIYNGTTDMFPHVSGKFSPTPDPLSYSKTVPINTTYVAPTSTVINPCYPNTTGGNLINNTIADKSSFLISTAFAARYIGPGSSGSGNNICNSTTTIHIAAHYEYYYGTSTVIFPGSSAVFSLSTLVAPAASGTYTETWQMNNGTFSFGTPFSTTIQVGSGGGGVTNATVASMNDVTGGAVTSSWIFSDGNGTVTTIDQTQATYANRPLDSNGVDITFVSPTTGSAGSLYSFAGIRNNRLASNRPASAEDIVSYIRNAFASVAFAQTSCASGSFTQVAGVYTCSGGPDPSLTGTSSTFPAYTILWNPVPALSATTTPSPLDFTASSTTGTITIQNSGAAGSALDWSASTTYTGQGGWLTPDTGSGTITNGASESGANGATSSLALSLSSGALSMPVGTYHADVIINGTSTFCTNPNTPGSFNCSGSPTDIAATLTITQSATVKSVSVTVSPNQIAPGATAQAVGTVTYSDGSTDHNVTYSSDNTGVVTVDPSTGVVTGVAPGSANIEAVSNASSSYFATAGVLVPGGCSGVCIGGNPSVSVKALPKTITHAETATCSATVTGTASTTVIWSAQNGQIIGSGNPVTLSPSSASTATCIATLAADKNVSSSDTVNVVNIKNPLNAPACSISASPTSVLIPQSTTLSYSCKNVSSCTMSGGAFGNQSTVSVNGSSDTAIGSTQDAPTQNTVYTITCYGTNTYTSVSSSANVSVTVSNPGRSETNP